MTILWLILLLEIRTSVAIWPPGYSVNLTEEDTFVISEDISSDVDDVYNYDEDEMIRESDLKSFQLQKDAGKFYRIHRMAMQHNRNYAKKNIKTVSDNVKVYETNFDLEEPLPWEAGFVNKNSDENKNVQYLNAMAQYTINEKTNKKREEEILAVKNIKSLPQNDYDYGNLEAEYKKQMKNALQSSDTLNHTEAKEEELVKEAVHKLIDFKEMPKNCTEEERKGIGLGAVECFWMDLNKPATDKTGKMQVIQKIGRLVLIWFCIYLAVVIPCWCQRGWCCCCFQCRFCKPRLRIDEAKTFFMNNPPGTYTEPDNEKITYTPTRYEQYEYKRLEHVLYKL